VTRREKAFLRSARVARLATADASGQPHVIPICYAFDGRDLYSPIDEKPKRTSPLRLKRIRNIGSNPKVAVVVDPSQLDDQSRSALEAELASAGFVFEVTGVLAIEEEVEIRHWRVATRQGERRFQTRLDDWPLELPGGGLLIRDVAGDLYRLRYPRTLDRRSRELLWALVD